MVRIIRVVAAGVAVAALAVGSAAVAAEPTGAPVADTGWGW